MRGEFDTAVEQCHSKHQLVSLSIAKIYALSRLEPVRAQSVLRSGKAERMSDISFLRMARRHQKQSPPRVILPNLSKSLDSAFVRLEQSVRRWQHSEVPMPPSVQLRYQSRIQSINRMLERIRRASAAAM